MSVLAVLLRGVNVGGAGTRLAMVDFRKALLAAGCDTVETYIQSGNAVVQSAVPPAELADRIGAAITLPNGTHPAVLVLSAGELDDALQGNPFPEAAGVPKSLHLAFLDRDAAPDLDDLQRRAVAGERFDLRGRVFYLHTPEGFGRSKVAARMEAAFSPARITARNLSTVTVLAAMARGLSGAAPRA